MSSKSVAEALNDKLEKRVDRMEDQVNGKFDNLTEKIEEGFKNVNEKIDAFVKSQEPINFWAKQHKDGHKTFKRWTIGIASVVVATLLLSCISLAPEVYKNYQKLKALNTEETKIKTNKR